MSYNYKNNRKIGFAKVELLWANNKIFVDQDMLPKWFCIFSVKTHAYK